MINKILLAVDGSQHAQSATDLAAELAGKLGAELLIVHVLMHGRPSAELVRMAEAEHIVQAAHTAAIPDATYIRGSHLEALGTNEKDKAKFARIIAALGDEIVARAKASSLESGARSVETLVHSGDYAEEILDVADTHSADMIVIGSRGLGRIKSTVLGSVSQKVLHHASCAVVIVR